ncbi:MAG: transposase [Rubrobacteraceae bacterium]
MCPSLARRRIRPRGMLTLTGFDLGLKSYLVSSDGAVTKPLRALKRGEKKLKRERRGLSRKKKGSSNRRKQRRKVARRHEKVANRRRDFLHKTSRNLTDSHEGFAFEKLRVRKGYCRCGMDYLRQHDGVQG